MPCEISSIKPCPCTFKGCKKSFNTIQEFWTHRDREHEYCKKCDLEFADWEEHVAHKARSDKHISCSICGMDFRSEGGLDLHFKQNHARDQRLPCRGCDKIFFKAGAFVAHIEQNKCRNDRDKTREIHKTDLQAEYHRRIILANIVAKSTPLYETIASTPGTPSVVSESYLATDDGGVQIQVDYVDVAVAKPAAAMIRSAYPALTIARLSAFDSMSQTSFGTRFTKSNDSDTSSMVVVNKIAEDEQPPPSRPVTATRAFSGTPLAGPSQSIDPQAFAKGLAAIDTQYDLKENKILNTKFWDPKSNEFNPELFFDRPKQSYVCPWPGCGHLTTSPRNLTVHMRNTDIHDDGQFRCKSCLKIFQKASALISHLESSSATCKAQMTKEYAKLIDIFSGGYLSLKEEMDGSGPKFVVSKPL